MAESNSTTMNKFLASLSLLPILLMLLLATFSTAFILPNCSQCPSMLNNRISIQRFQLFSTKNDMNIEGEDIDEATENNNNECRYSDKSVIETMQSWNNHNGCINLNGSSKLILPVFPLRKSVRIPTDSLRLNLYEDRYLDLSAYVLSSSSFKNSNNNDSHQQPLFGALYCSHKAQLVPNGGMDPIVPVLDPGDVGVLCQVQSSLDSMVPCRDPTLGMRRRIRLNGVAVGRFQVVNVLSDGCQRDKQNDLSFLVVEASLITDQQIQSVTDMEQAIEISQNLIHQIQMKTQKTTTTKTDSTALLIDNAEQSHDQVMSSWARYQNNKDDLQNGQEQQELHVLSKHLELFSFAALSALLDYKESPTDILNLLQMDSTLGRLQKMNQMKNRHSRLWKF